MTPTQEWIDRYTASPETLAKIRDQRAAKLPEPKGGYVGEDMAKQYLGLCPGCTGMVNFGHMFIRRNGTAYHSDCAPDRPEPKCWCGVEITPPETEHQGCYNTRMAFSWWGRQLAGIFSKPRVSWPKLRGFKA